MAEAWSTDRLLKLTRRLARALSNRDGQDARDLDASIFRLDRCLIDIRRNYPPTAPLLWIDDVGAALQSALRHLRNTDPHPNNNSPPNPRYSTTITSSSATLNHNSHPHQRSRPPNPKPPFPDTTTKPIHLPIASQSHRLSHYSRRHDHSRSQSTTSVSQSRRHSIASLFSSQARSNRLSNTFSRSFQSSANNSSISERVRYSFSRFLSGGAPPQAPPRAQTIVAATRIVNEWLAAVRASKEDNTVDDAESWISLSDALPPLPQQYTPCRDNLYQCAREALIKASLAVPTAMNDRSATTAVALVGPHGVGKTMLAMELVQDVELCHSFADGVAWIQLGPDINDEELADQIIRCVETIIAGDFRSTVRYCNSLEAVVSRASRLLRRVSSLVVIDDVSGPRAQRAFDMIISALGASSVTLYTSPVDDEEFTGDSLSLERVTCVAKLFVRPLEPASTEAKTIFRSWLTKTQSDLSREGTLMHAKDQMTILMACHGLPLPLAMAAGFLSKFPASWQFLAVTLNVSPSGEETIFRIMRVLQAKGGPRFESQLRDIACLPQGVWVSLSALADIWGMDYRSVKTSARRLGRMAFAEYRLGDSSDDSRVRFHWHILRFCGRIATAVDERNANRKLLSNIYRRRTQNMKPRLRVEYLPWWSGCVTDKYMVRRLHWHISGANAFNNLNDLICDYQWVCQRLERDGLIGVTSEFMLAMASEDRNGRTAEALGIQNILIAIQEAAKLRKSECIEMNALPTFLVSRLRSLESSSTCCQEFLASVYEKARRPWLRPVPPVESPLPSSLVESVSTDSVESEPLPPYLVNCLTSSTSGKVVCGDRHGNIQVYDPATGKNIVSWSSSGVEGPPLSRGVGALATVQDFVVSGHFNGQLFLRSIRSGRIELIQDSSKVRDKISCIASTENGIIAVGSQTGKLFVLKSVEDFGAEPVRIDMEGHCDVVTSLHVFPDGTRIASSSYDGFAAIWKLSSEGQERLSLNGHKPDIGHKENYITTFATIAAGKRLLSSCRGGVVSAWNTETGDCLWTQRYGYEFSRSQSLQAFGIRHFATSFREAGKAMSLLNVGYPYVITRGEGPKDLLILAAGKGREVLATVTTEQVISTWLEVWHPSSQRIYVAVSHADGRMSSYELVTSLK